MSEKDGERAHGCGGEKRCSTERREQCPEINGPSPAIGNEKKTAEKVMDSEIMAG